MVLTPFHDDDVISTVADGVVDLVVVASDVLDEHLLARAFRSVDCYEEEVVSWFERVTLSTTI